MSVGDELGFGKSKKFELKVAKSHGDVAWVRLTGPLGGAEMFRQSMENHVHAVGLRYVILDCRDMGHISSGGFGALIFETDKLHQSGGALVILDPPETFHTISNILGLGEFMTVVKSDKEARDLLSEGGAARASLDQI